jgi:membrane protein implicated in regulation of membrane protease activity
MPVVHIALVVIVVTAFAVLVAVKRWRKRRDRGQERASTGATESGRG